VVHYLLSVRVVADAQGHCLLQVAGQDKIKLRSEDAAYLKLVDRWWSVLLPKIGRFLVERGGNILMVQVQSLVLQGAAESSDTSWGPCGPAPCRRSTGHSSSAANM
jgi:hypothetical protein